MTPGTFEITPVPQVASPHEVGRWLDASTRQMIVELAFAGACHGMTCEARTILGALPHLVDDTVTQHWLHAALLLALGDTDAARNALARDDEGDVSAAATVNGASDLRRYISGWPPCQPRQQVRTMPRAAFPLPSPVSPNHECRFDSR
jgi:type III secretion system SsaH family protein